MNVADDLSRRHFFQMHCFAGALMVNIRVAVCVCVRDLIVLSFEYYSVFH